MESSTRGNRSITVEAAVRCDETDVCHVFRAAARSGFDPNALRHQRSDHLRVSIVLQAATCSFFHHVDDRQFDVPSVAKK